MPAGKRLAPMLSELADRLRRCVELDIDDDTAALLAGMSAATLDRRLAPERKKHELKGRSHTKPGSLLKSQIPIRTGPTGTPRCPGSSTTTYRRGGSGRVGGVEVRGAAPAPGREAAAAAARGRGPEAGSGRIKAIAGATGVHPDTVAGGMRELEGLRNRRRGCVRLVVGPRSWPTPTPGNWARRSLWRLRRRDQHRLVSVGTDHDTSAFAVATLRSRWDTIGRRRCLHARELLICADGGGSNGYRVRTRKIELTGLAAETGLTITVCHLPPGASKWNKIEHRLFSQITMNWRGRPLESHRMIAN